MTIKCKDIFNLLEEIAPINLKIEWDNVGNIIGDSNKNVKNILISLDTNNKVIKEAINKNIDLIINHHPLIFKPIYSINDNTSLGKNIIKLIKNDISVYCAHTNLDISNYGTNDKLFEILELENKENFLPVNKEGFSLGRIGSTKKILNLKNFSKFIKNKLNLENIRYVGEDDKIIKKVSLCTGAGISKNAIALAKEKNCDVFITGDIKFHEAQNAIDNNIALIDATHYGTENIINEYIKKYLDEKLKDKNIKIFISEVKGDVFKNL